MYHIYEPTGNIESSFRYVGSVPGRDEAEWYLERGYRVIGDGGVGGEKRILAARHGELGEYMTDPVLHLYPLEREHGDAAVIGNREGLRLLRDAIKDALQEGEGQTTYLGVSAEDGESYDLGVTLQLGGPHADGEWREPYFVARNKYRELGGKRERIAEYLDSHAASMEYSRTDDTPESVRTRQQGAALLRETVRLIRDGARLRGE